jgi:hypothetical protein
MGKEKEVNVAILLVFPLLVLLSTSPPFFELPACCLTGEGFG